MILRCCGGCLLGAAIGVIVALVIGYGLLMFGSDDVGQVFCR